MLVVFMLVTLPSFAGPVKVSGRVQDVNAEPLIGVTIREKGTQNATITDLNGQYTITVNGEKAVLVAEYVGFKPEEQKVHGTLVDFVLHEDVSALDEVVVTGYATQKKVSVLGAQSTLKMEHVKAPVANMSSILAGRVSGVVAVQRTGLPGQDDSDIWIRGISTLTGRNEGPLVLVDGIERDFNQLDPEDIESVTVLKDAASTAVYGVRGGNGVIIITTKPGIVSKPKFSFDVYQGVTSLTKVPSLVNGVQYMNAVNEAYMHSNNRQYYSDAYINNTMIANGYALSAEQEAYRQSLLDASGNLPRSINKYLYPDVNWMKELYHDMGWNRRANVNIRGGAPNASYYISLSYYQERGMTKTDPAQDYSTEINYDRYNFLSNINLKATKTTNIDMGVSGYITAGNYPDQDINTIFTKAMSTNPVIYPIIYPSANGDLNPGYSQHQREYDSPWVTMARRGYQTDYRTQVNTNLKLTQDLGFWNWSKGLSARALVSFDVRATQSIAYAVDNSTWKPSGAKDMLIGDTWADPMMYKDANGNWAYNQYHVADDGTFTDGDGNKVVPLYNNEGYIVLAEQYQGNSSMSVSSSKSVYRTFYFETALDYKRTFDKRHNVSGLVVFNLRNHRDANSSDLLLTIPYKQESLSGRVTYDYDNRYFFEGNLGYTGSENFAKGHRFGLFPAIAVGWVPSNESWWKPIQNVVSFAKIRFSDGTVGNASLGDGRFGYFSAISNGSSYNTYWGNGGLYISKYGYQAQWSKIRKHDLGIEMKFLNDDLSMVLDLFKERRTKIWVPRENLPIVAGFSTSAGANLGIVKNKGFEYSLEWNHQFGKDLFVSLRGNYTWNRDEVIEDCKAEPAYPWKATIGHNVLSRQGFIALGLFTSEEDIKENNICQFGETYPGENTKPGDIKYKDLNGDGYISEADICNIGHGDVPSAYYGFGGDIRYKNIGVGVLFQGTHDADRCLNGEGIFPFKSSSGGGTLYANIEDRWSEADPENQDVFYPRLAWGEKDPSNQNNFVTSTWWQKDVSFLRLKQFTVSYYFPKAWQKGGVLKGGRFYVMGQNVFTWSPFKLWDPELNTNNGISYPNVRTFSFGVNFNL